jgi:putative ABC transport system substrate-binding protein
VTPLYTPQIDAAAKVLGIEPVYIEFEQGADYAAQFQRVVAANVDAVFQTAYTELNTSYGVLYDLYLAHRLPAFSAGGIQVGSDIPFAGVIGYSVDQLGTIRTWSAAMVDAVIKGAKPRDVPVQNPTTFILGINTWMADQLGLPVPPTILVQATLVIDYDLRAPKSGGAK